MRLLVLLLILTCEGVFAEEKWVLVADGPKYIFPVEDELSDVQPYERTPLITNLPFLQLRTGDRLVRAARAPRGKEFITGEKPVGYYLVSGDQRFHLSITEEAGDLKLDDPVQTVLFAWDFSDANADTIRDLVTALYLGRMMDEEAYGKVRDVVRRDFPAAEVSPLYGFPLPARSRRFPGQSFREYDLIAVGRSDTTVAKYRLRIGPSIFSLHEHVLIRGPEPVDPSDFEDPSHSTLANARPPSNLSPAMKAEKKAAYDRMIRFQKLISETLGRK
jgi:hypothetical protein